METEELGFHPMPVCCIPKCPHQTSARLTESEEYEGKRRRKDLCKRHALVTKHHYKDKVEIIAVWNELTLEDFDE